MKLKLVVASMSVLSIISVPTFAYLTGANPAASTNSTASSDNSGTTSSSDSQTSAAADAAAAAAAASASVHGSNTSSSTEETQATTAPTKSTATHIKKSASEKKSKPVTKTKTSKSVKKLSKTSHNKTHKSTTYVTHKAKASHTHHSLHESAKAKKHANKTLSAHKKAHAHEKHVASKHTKHPVPVKHKAIVKHAVPVKKHIKPVPVVVKHEEQAASVVPAPIPVAQTATPPKPIMPPQEMTYKPAMATVSQPNKQRATLDAMTQNSGRGHPRHSWYNRIFVNGGMNVDAAWGNRLLNYMGKNPSRLSVNDIYLNTTALVNDWTKVFSSISFNNAYPANLSATALDGIKKIGRYSYVYPTNTVSFEQAYVTFGNFDCSPFFAQIGKQYQPFGRYEIHPIERSMTQVLTESLQTSAEVGFVSKAGVSGAVYAFDNSLTRSNVGHTLPVYGAMLAIDQPSSDIGYDMGLGYMSNMAGVNDVASAITNYQTASVASGTNTAGIGTYQASIGAMSFYVDLNSGPITLGARYAASTSRFGTQTLSNNFINADGSTARPWAIDLSAAYAFNAWTKPQNVYVGYQTSNNAVNLSLPKNRYLAGYSVDVLQNTSFGIQWDRDVDYSSGNGGTGLSSNTVSVRAAVKFG